MDSTATTSPGRVRPLAPTADDAQQLLALARTGGPGALGQLLERYITSREEAAFPAPWLRQAKYWPPVKRIDNVAGDRQLVCTCPPIEAYA